MLHPPAGSRRLSGAASSVAVVAAILIASAPGWALVLLSGEGGSTDRVTYGTATLAVAALVAALGALVARSAWRRNDSRAMIGAFAMATATVLLTAQGMALIGDAQPDDAIVRLPGLLVIPVSCTVLTLTRVRGVVRPGRETVVMRTGVITLLIVTAIALAWGGDPSLIPFNIGAGTPGALAVFAVAALLILLLVRSSVRTALLSRRPLDAMLCVGLLWLLPAHYGLTTGLPGEMRWTIGHGMQICAFVLAGLHTGIDLRRGAASGPLMGHLRTSRLVEQSAEFLGSRVTNLVERLTEKDPSTAGHVQRVALLAVQMGEHLHVPTGRLRLLAAGGLLHDIGKLSVPAEVLTKPARLTDEEFEIVQRHPADGRELLSELGGFHELVLDLVELHHERLDGSGYPHGRGGAELALEVRILAVADVFDALTTDRPYRRAMSAFDALSELADQAGSGLDERCVHALRQVLGSDQLIDIRERVRGAIPSTDELPAVS